MAQCQLNFILNQALQGLASTQPIAPTVLVICLGEAFVRLAVQRLGGFVYFGCAVTDSGLLVPGADARCR